METELTPIALLPVRLLSANMDGEPEVQVSIATVTDSIIASVPLKYIVGPFNVAELGWLDSFLGVDAPGRLLELGDADVSSFLVCPTCSSQHGIFVNVTTGKAICECGFKGDVVDCVPGKEGDCGQD